MKRAAAFTFVLVLLPTLATAAGPYYARGDYFSGTIGEWGFGAVNQLFDDGQHGDDEAGDGIYGAYVVADKAQGMYGFKIANEDWTENFPNHPSYPTENARVYVGGPSDLIHFRLDTNTVDGWQPAAYAVATDQWAAPGLSYEVIGNAPETGNWLWGVSAVQVGSMLIAESGIATPGAYEFKFRVVGAWDVCNFGADYNMLIGENFVYTTTQPNATVRFEMNLATGRGRALEFDPTPTRPTTWGRVKALYR